MWHELFHLVFMFTYLGIFQCFDGGQHDGGADVGEGQLTTLLL